MPWGGGGGGAVRGRAVEVRGQAAEPRRRVAACGGAAAELVDESRVARRAQWMWNAAPRHGDVDRGGGGRSKVRPRPKALGVRREGGGRRQDRTWAPDSVRQVGEEGVARR